jgi:hypothetical protein
LNAINEIADELRKVWWELPEDVQEIQFWPFGLPGMRKPKTEELFTGYRHLIVSPFISPSGLQIALGDSKETSVSIVSRGDELIDFRKRRCLRQPITRSIHSLV